MTRSGNFERTTKETDIKVSITLSHAGESSIDSGIPFFDHMLSAMAKHGLMKVDLTCKGDLAVDGHHTVEDIGICLGQAITRALGGKRGIKRFGFASVPMDESLCEVSIDISGRPYFVYNGPSLDGLIGLYSGELTREFLLAFATNAGLNLHVNLAYGDNKHHMQEAIFKALGRALREACSLDAERPDEIPSTKGSL